MVGEGYVAENKCIYKPAKAKEAPIKILLHNGGLGAKPPEALVFLLFHGLILA